MDIKRVTSVESSQSMGTKEICILVMDYDPACLDIVAEMLRYCSHKVLHFGRTTDALDAIWKRKDRLDLVLTNVNSSDTSGFEILQHIEREFKLPIISMSPDENKRTVSRGLASGIKLYFVKSLSMNDINNLWQYAYAREKGKLVDSAKRASSTPETVGEAGIGNTSTVGEATRGYQRRKREEPKETSEQNEVSRDDSPSEKKPRVVWTSEMHHKFLEAIGQLGHEKAFPKKIVEVMNVPGLTRENVASHLQKYRLCLKRVHEGLQPSSSVYGINLTTGFKEACFPSSHTTLNFNLSPQQHNVSSLHAMPQPNALVNHNFRVYGDQTNQPTSSGMSSTYVGYRLTSKGNSIEFGQMGVLCNDQVLSVEDHFGNGSSVHCPSTSINYIPQEQPSLPPLPPLHHELDSFGAEGDLDVLLGAITSASPEMFWDGDFDDTLFNHTD